MNDDFPKQKCTVSQTVFRATQDYSEVISRVRVDAV
jgi:hypothetical protein